VLLFVLIYLVSLGPVMWLWAHDVIYADTFQMLYRSVYFPISSVRQNTDFFADNPIGRAYDSYLRWCFSN